MSKWRGPVREMFKTVQRKGFERDPRAERFGGERDFGRTERRETQAERFGRERDFGRTVESKTESRGPSKGTSTDDAKYQQKKEDLKRKASSYRDRKSGRATGLDDPRDRVKPGLEEGNRGGRRYKPAQRDKGRDPDRSKRAGRDLERRLNRRSGAQDRDKQKANYRDKESGRATGLDKSGLKEPRRSKVSRLKARLRRRRARRRMR